MLGSMKWRNVRDQPSSRRMPPLFRRCVLMFVLWPPHVEARSMGRRCTRPCRYGILLAACKSFCRAFGFPALQYAALTRCTKGMKQSCWNGLLAGGLVSVDSFSNDAAVFLLSHCHTDHMVGLADGWCRGPLYTTEQNRAFVLQRFRIDPVLVHAVPFYEETLLIVGAAREQIKGTARRSRTVHHHCHHHRRPAHTAAP